MTYKNRLDCQNTCKSHKTSQIVGWIVGWKLHCYEGLPYLILG